MLFLSFGLRRSANCLDVGANEGLFLADFRRIAPDGYHVAYEPLAHLHEMLVREYPEMDIRQRALSDHEGESSFVHVTDPNYEGYSGFRVRPYPVDVPTETISVKTERLDDHLPEGWLPDFVKIDVEGAEGLVIVGGIDTLRRSRPMMAIEHGWDGSEGFGCSDEEFFNLVSKDIGLRLFDMDGHGPFDRIRFLDTLHSGRHWNWIAHD
ncbi:MAG: FkbM family methyltransferase [Acidimicrobiales bacterium]|jgi:FkbM family methyltransferase